MLSELDVVVGVGKQSYSFQSHSGNVGLNNEIIKLLPAFSSTHRTVTAEWICRFIHRFEEKGSRFLVRVGDASFRLSTKVEKFSTVICCFKKKNNQNQ